MKSVPVMLILVMVTIGVPWFRMKKEEGEYRDRCHRTTCIAKLKQLRSAKEQWAIDNHASTGAKLSLGNLIGPYLKTSPTCPQGGTYKANAIGTNPECIGASEKGHVIPW